MAEKRSNYYVDTFAKLNLKEQKALADLLHEDRMAIESGIFWDLFIFMPKIGSRSANEFAELCQIRLLNKLSPKLEPEDIEG